MEFLYYEFVQPSGMQNFYSSERIASMNRCANCLGLALSSLYKMQFSFYMKWKLQTSNWLLLPDSK